MNRDLFLTLPEEAQHEWERLTFLHGVYEAALLAAAAEIEECTGCLAEASYQENRHLVFGRLIEAATMELMEKRPAAYASAFSGEMGEALQLLGMWYSRWQGFTAGTPHEMHLRTSRMLTANGMPPQSIPVQST